MVARGEQERSVEALLADGRLSEAARRCTADGDHARASRLHEQACEFREAAIAASRAGEPTRALGLAILAGDEELADALRVRLCEALGSEGASNAAADLSARGLEREAARLWARAGDWLRAAGAFERAGAPLDAGQAYDRAARPAEAARVLEAALRSPLGARADGTGPGPDALRLALGRLYAKHGRHEAALRHLQRIEHNATHRAEALGLLCTSLEQLGLVQALGDARGELAALGTGPVRAARDEPHGAPPASPPPAQSTDADRGPGRGAAELKLFGRYLVGREIGRTPHARLLDAVDEVTGERVAVKIFAAELRGAGRDAWHRFAREAEVLGKLRHPCVVELREFLPSGPAIVMPWMAGGSLRELLEREPLAPARAAEIAAAVLAALAEAHRRGILHRDVKPSNVLFDAAGAARLADFGAAHLGAAGATVTAAEIGTAAYMSPEQRRGEPATAASDLYGTGILLCEMLHGSVPSSERRPSQWHPDLGAAHDELVSRLCAASPADRFADAASAHAALTRLTWPRRRIAVPQPRDANRGARRAPPPTVGRLVPSDAPHGPTGARRLRDCWLERDVLLIADEPAARARAAAFARADHPALPLVLRIDAAAGEIWVAAPSGQPLDAGRVRLEAHEGATLRAALAALHRAGGAHGAVDPSHVFVDEGGPTLAWPAGTRAAADATADLAALAELMKRPTV